MYHEYTNGRSRSAKILLESVFRCWNGANSVFVTASNLLVDDAEPEPDEPAVSAFVSTASGLCFAALAEDMMVARVHVQARHLLTPGPQHAPRVLGYFREPGYDDNRADFVSAQ